jgi:hypothetical protein
LIDRIKTVEQNYKWIIYRLCFENYQNKNEIINTETVDQIILDSDDQANATSLTSIGLQGSSCSVFFCSAQQYCLYSADDDDSYCNSRHVDCMVCDMPCHDVCAVTFTKDYDMETVITVCKLCKEEILDEQEKVSVKPFVTKTNDGYPYMTHS